MGFVRDAMTTYPKSLAHAVERYATQCRKMTSFAMAAKPRHVHAIIAVTMPIQGEESLMEKLFVQNAHTGFL
ncbi:hypothetical protein MMIC_P1323 [Mariprofundus micogutta]|uniref:Uncharacterized protein n=1 Tax=Mariprofundus micogutta TaxID=1921010 RepID=A0A1L8CN65_9PROT|nr:hypothetical protein MMIC_P1323 [Mariprofundus micogutta]